MIDPKKIWESRFRLLAHAADMELGPGALRVFTNLLMRFNIEDDACRPAVSTIARDVGMSTRTVFRVLAQLEAEDLLSIIARAGRSSMYRPNFEAVENDLGSMPWSPDGP
jgi:hypothetical protein